MTERDRAMRTLDHYETLLFYDGVQLFLARDQVGTAFVCLLAEQGAESDRYLCLAASARRVSALRAGEVDLRELYASPEVEEFYEAESTRGDLCGLTAARIPRDRIPASWLPEVGLFLRPEEATAIEVVQEAVGRGRAVVHCRLNPPEARQEAKITAEHLAQAVKLVQRVVKHAYARAIRDLDASVRASAPVPESYELEVFGFSPGSFTVHMQSSGEPDLFGYVQVAKALELIDSVTALVDRPEDAVRKISEYGGHFASAYRDLVRFIIDTETEVQYQWAMPESRYSKRYGISNPQAKPIWEAMSQRLDIGVEEKRLVGRLTKVDEKYGTWRLVNEADRKEYTGTSERDGALDGSVIETQRYELVCEERLEEERGTGREITRLYLKSLRPL